MVNLNRFGIIWVIFTLSYLGPFLGYYIKSWLLVLWGLMIDFSYSIGVANMELVPIMTSFFYFFEIINFISALAGLFVPLGVFGAIEIIGVIVNTHWELAIFPIALLSLFIMGIAYSKLNRTHKVLLISAAVAVLLAASFYLNGFELHKEWLWVLPLIALLICLFKFDRIAEHFNIRGIYKFILILAVLLILTIIMDFTLWGSWVSWRNLELEPIYRVVIKQAVGWKSGNGVYPYEDWEKYTNEEIGISFFYPLGFQVADGVIYGTGESMQGVTLQDPSSPDYPAVTIEYHKTLGEFSMAAPFPRNSLREALSHDLTDIEEVLIDDTKGYRGRFTNLAVPISYISEWVEHGRGFYQINYGWTIEDKPMVNDTVLGIVKSIQIGK